jgi:hypothetical protein
MGDRPPADHVAITFRLQFRQYMSLGTGGPSGEERGSPFRTRPGAVAGPGGITAILDPAGEKLAGGLVKAPKMTSAECHKKYG